MKKMAVLFGLISSLVISEANGDSPATFYTSFKNGNYHQALTLWPQSHEARTLTNTNQALYAFALYKDNMPLLGFNVLTNIRDLNSISSSVKSLWRNELNANSSFWRNTNLIWNKKWQPLFTDKIASVISAWSTHDLNSDADFKRAQSLLRNLEGTDPGAWVKWQLALGYGEKDRTAISVDYLQSLIDSDQHAINQDQILMAAARMLYQDNKLDLAMKYYDQIPKTSDYWLEALEERAWIYARLNNFERTLGEMKTVLNPAFASQVGPESYFLATLADLRLCDYYSIFKLLKDFKARNETRLIEIQKLADTGHSPASDQALAKLEAGVQSWADLGSNIDRLPRFVNRDEVLSRATNRMRMAHQGFENIKILNAQNPYFTKLVNAAVATIKENESAAPARLKILAGQDVQEMRKNLMKLQLIETEAIQRMHVGQTYAPKSKGAVAQKQVRDAIEFPYEDKEVWMDELDHYQANAKGCPVAVTTPAKKGQTL